MPFTEMKMHMKWMNAFWGSRIGCAYPCSGSGARG